MSIKIRNLELGTGMPKICIPITGSNREQIERQLEEIHRQPFDLAEWRCDFFENVSDPEAVKDMIRLIRQSLGEKPFLFTFRTKWEGGEKEIQQEAYRDLICLAARTNQVDLIDAELFRESGLGREVKPVLEQHAVRMVGSNHDFEKTPPSEEIVTRLLQMKENGADIPKIAVMPRSGHDVLELLKATWEFCRYAPKTPVITMAMGGVGMISRVAGEAFGSAVTFGSAGVCSAPGQIPAKKLRDVLEILHNPERESGKNEKEGRTCR